MGSIAFGLKYGVPYMKDKFGNWQKDTSGTVREALATIDDASNHPNQSGWSAELGRMVCRSSRSPSTAQPRDTELGPMPDRGPYIELPDEVHTRPL